MSSLWIKMQLIPLPTAAYPELLIYWNAETGQFLGERVDLITQCIDMALSQGLPGFELSDPYHKPSELAAILSQHYIVVPEPLLETPNFIDSVSELRQ